MKISKYGHGFIPMYHAARFMGPKHAAPSAWHHLMPYFSRVHDTSVVLYLRFVASDLIDSPSHLVQPAMTRGAGVADASSTDNDRPAFSLPRFSSIRVPGGLPHLNLSAVRPYLRRAGGAGDMELPPSKLPMLTLNLSSSSFLDAIIHDESSENPLYTITTVNATTRLMRNNGSCMNAEIRWPKVTPLRTKVQRETDGILITMGAAQWVGTETLLRPGILPRYASFSRCSFS